MDIRVVGIPRPSGKALGQRWAGGESPASAAHELLQILDKRAGIA